MATAVAPLPQITSERIEPEAPDGEAGNGAPQRRECQDGHRVDDEGQEQVSEAYVSHFEEVEQRRRQSRRRPHIPAPHLNLHVSAGDRVEFPELPFAAFQQTVRKRELGVRSVLEGSIRRVGNQVRVTAQLVDASTGGHVWAATDSSSASIVPASSSTVTISEVRSPG